MKWLVTLASAVLVVSFSVERAAAETFAVLTYNVRGIPAPAIEDRTAEIAAIAPLLEDFHTEDGGYDGIASVVQIQELFSQAYYDVLTDDQTVSYPFITLKDTSGPNGLGDGLNVLSDFQFTGFDRTQWEDCFGTQGANGSDCDTNKGYSFIRLELQSGVTVDVYNLHADAGQDEGSRTARRANITQLIDAIDTRSEGRAVIVMGDTNSHYTRTPNDNIETLLTGADVKDVWVELVKGGVVPGAGPDNESECETNPDGPNCELIDKVFYRSSEELTLSPTSYLVLDTLFSDAGGDLSDHFPVAVIFDFTLGGATTTSTTTTSVTVPTSTSTSTTTTLGGGTTTTLDGGTTTTLDGSTTTTTLFPPSTTTTLFPPTTTTTLPTSTECGDPVSLNVAIAGGVAGDALITASDALYVLRAAVGSATCELCLCDVDGNNNVTAVDALVTLKTAVGQATQLECPPCG